MTDGDLAGLPAEVAAVRARLAALLDRLGEDPGPQDPGHQDPGRRDPGRRDPGRQGAPRGDPGWRDPGWRPPDPGGRGRPAVAVLAAPGRGRRALVAALLGLDTIPATAARIRRPDGGAVPARADGEAPDELVVDVPLLAEFDLLLPGPEGAVPAGTAAALVVVGAGAPLDRHEVAQVVAVAATVEHVLVALAGTDAHRGWRTVLTADRELMAAAVPRLADAPWFPCAPALAGRAAELAGSGAGADAVRAVDAATGLAPLRAALHRLVARRRRMLGEVNALRALATALRAAAGPADPAPAGAAPAGAAPAGPAPAGPAPAGPGAAPGTGPGAGRAAARRRERHVRWRTGLAQARLATTDDLTARTRALGAALREQVETGTRAELDAVPGHLTAELDRTAAAVVAGLAARLRDLVAATLGDLVAPADLADLVLPPPRPVPAPVPPGTAGASADDRLLVVAGAAGGLGASRIALLPLLAAPLAPVAAGAAVGTAALPVAVVVGLGVAGWMVRARRTAAGRARHRAWVAEALVAARADLERAVAEALVVADREVSLALDTALDAAAPEPSTVADRSATRAARARAGAEEAEALLARLARLARPTS